MTTVWSLYQLSIDYTKKLCSKRCYDLRDECQEYLLERISRNDMARLKSFKGISSKSTFAYVIVNNLIKDFLKTKKSVVSYDEMSYTSLCEESDSIEDQLIKEHDKKQVKIALKRLDKEDQLIIKLRYFDEYRVCEVATVFEKTPKQISKKIEMIKNRLKKILNREDFSF